MSKTVKVNPERDDVVITHEGIIHYDKDNRYPNNYINLIKRSSTATAVLRVKDRFVYGKGMTESGDFWKRKINRSGMRVDQLTRRIIASKNRFDGFALHFNYNALFQKVSVKVVDFEHARIGKPDDEDYSGKILIYPKWGRERWSARKGEIYDVYNPDPEIIARQVELAGGWEKYKGQVWYFGQYGEVSYPENPFASAKNDMLAEILISEGKYSNSSSNFLASQIFVLPGTYKELSPYPEDAERYDRGEQTFFEKEIMEMLASMQGAGKMGSIAVMENNVKDNEGNPVEFKTMDFKVQNFDKIHEYTEKSCEDSIIKVSGVPHILLKPTATGFSQELLDNYYQFYNESTSYDRQVIEEVMEEIFRGWFFEINPNGNYSIKPLGLTIDREDNTSPANMQ